MSEHMSPIPSRIYNAAVGGHVCGADDVIDDVKGKKQSQINNEVDSAIQNEIERATEAENNRYTKSEVYKKEETYNKTELNNLITTPEQQYVTLTAQSGDTLEDIFDGVTGAADTIYRVGSWDGSQYNTTKYTEYAWNGTNFVPLDVKEYGIDDEPTAGSDNLVKSGGVRNHIGEVGFEKYSFTKGDTDVKIPLNSFYFSVGNIIKINIKTTSALVYLQIGLYKGNSWVGDYTTIENVPSNDIKAIELVVPNDVDFDGIRFYSANDGNPVISLVIVGSNKYILDLRETINNNYELKKFETSHLYNRLGINEHLIPAPWDNLSYPYRNEVIQKIINSGIRNIRLSIFSTYYDVSTNTCDFEKIDNVIGLIYKYNNWSDNINIFITLTKDSLSIAEYLSFYRLVTTRYNGVTTFSPNDLTASNHPTIKFKINYWEGLNEPDISNISSSDTFEVQRGIFAIVRELIPDAKVLSASLQDPTLYLTELLELSYNNDGVSTKYWDYFDYFNYHTYMTTPYTVITYHLDRLQAQFNTYAMNKPIIATEMGWSTGHYESGDMSEKTQALYMLKTLIMELAYNVSKLIIYKYRATETDTSVESNYGIVHNTVNGGVLEFDPKQSYTAINNLNKYIGKTGTVLGLVIYNDLYIAKIVSSKGIIVYALWTKSGSITLSLDRFDTTTIVKNYLGEVITANLNSITITEDVVYIENLKCLDIISEVF